jgi:hypothetical protein
MELQKYLDIGLVHSIHTSVRRSFRSCRRRWDLTYRQMYYPKVLQEHLDFGVWFHAAMEKFYDPMTWTDFEVKQALALASFNQAYEHGLKDYRRRNGEPEVDILNKFKELKNLGLGMIKHYTEHVSPVVDLGFTPVRVEMPFEVAVLSPEGDPLWCTCDQCFRKWMHTEPKDWTTQTWSSIGEYHKAWRGLPVTYGGRLDMLAIDDLGRYWIFDWKTTSRILDEDAEASFLQLDDQIASYCWALRSLGIPVAGFVYVEIKKTFPQPPLRLEKPRKECHYSVNRQFLTTPELFESTVKEHDSYAYSAGLYDGHIEWLKTSGPVFHQRHQIHKNDHEIAEIGHNIWLEAQDILGSPRVYPQPGRFSCPSCLFRQPCLGQNMGEDYVYTLETMYEKHEKHYYEERPPTTE